MRRQQLSSSNRKKLSTLTARFRKVQQEAIVTLMTKLQCSEREAHQVLAQLLDVPSESIS